jgi:hypothetical protein
MLGAQKEGRGEPAQTGVIVDDPMLGGCISIVNPADPVRARPAPLRAMRWRCRCGPPPR